MMTTGDRPGFAPGIVEHGQGAPFLPLASFRLKGAPGWRV
jgi:hypothetical protein